MQALQDATSEIEPTTDLDVLLTQILDKEIDLPSDFQPLFYTFVSISFGAQSTGKELDEFVEEALESVVFQTKNKKIAQDIDTTNIHRFIVMILSTKNPFGLSIKAAALGDESHNVFHQCRIISDVRHVFPESLTEGPAGNIVVHNLKIGYVGDGLQKNIYFACTRSELEELQRIIGRALEKESLLRASISKDIPSIRGN